MRTTVKLLNADDLNCRLTVDMSVSDLKRLKVQVDELPYSTRVAWPLAGLLEAAAETIRKAEQEFSTEVQSR